MINFFGRKIVKTQGRQYPLRVFVRTPLSTLCVVYKGHSSYRRRLSVSNAKSKSLNTFYKTIHFIIVLIIN